MFRWDVLRQAVPFGLLFGGYTLIFLLWRLTFLYTLPFLLGLLTALALQPVIRYVEGRLFHSHNMASGIVTILALALLLTALVTLCVYAIGEISAFLIRAAQGGFPEFSPPVQSFFRKIGAFFQNLDGGFWERNYDGLMEFLKNSSELAVGLLAGVLGVITSLPTMIMMLLITAFSAFFIARDFDKLRDWLLNLFSSHGLKLLKRIAKSSSGTGRRYILSYSLLYFISFCEAFVVLYILGLPYPLLTALITCAADVLPVLGPGIVFTPVAVYQLLMGEYGRGLGLLVGWLVMTCIRQVIEPRLVASTIKVHPLAMLVAVYFSLVAGSLWVLLYTAGFFMLYSLLQSAEVLPPFSQIQNTQTEDDISATESEP